MASFIPDVVAIEEIPQSPGVWTLLNDIGIEGTAIAKRLCLVYTGPRPGHPDVPGELRDSIRYRFTAEDGLPEVQIGSDVEYALHVEYGEFNTADLAPLGAFLRPMLMALRVTP